MTDGASLGDALQEAARRLGHETSNAANAAVVNLEALRSRLARGADQAQLSEFADRVSTSLDGVAAGVAALRALVLVATAPRDGSARTSAGFEVGGGDVPSLGSDAQRFAETAGVTLRPGERGIIFDVSVKNPRSPK